MKLLTLDNDEASRDALHLAVLEKAGEGQGPFAAACKAAHETYKAAIEAGRSHGEAKSEAKAALDRLSHA